MNDTETLQTIRVMQGKAASTDYFFIIQPVPGVMFTVGQPIECVNPKTKVAINGTVTEHYWIFDWAEPPRGLLIKEWGIEPRLLRKLLIDSDKGFEDEWARLILIKEKR